jgi:hypothetical protein
MSSASCLYTSGHKELKSPLQLGRLSKINHVSIAAKWLSPYAEILQGQMMIEWRKSWALFGLRRKGLKLGELGLAFAQLLARRSTRRKDGTWPSYDGSKAN